MSHPAIAAVRLLAASSPNATFADYPAMTEAFRADLFGETEAIDLRKKGNFEFGTQTFDG